MLCENNEWMLGDHLNAVRAVVKNGECVHKRLKFSAFGELLNEPDDEIAFAYTGKLFDAKAQLQWNINRWYDPKVGRWISEDPIGFEAKDANLVRYVGNEVVGKKDMNGLWKYVAGKGTFNGSLGPGDEAQYGRASSDFILYFARDKKAFTSKCCDKIQFIQIYYMDAPIWLTSLPNRQWTIDSSTPPYYPYGTFFNPTSDLTIDSSMHDAPNFDYQSIQSTPISKILSMRFEACAVCSEGINKDEVYGCLEWGHSFVVGGNGLGFKKITDRRWYLNNVIWGDSNIHQLGPVGPGGANQHLGGASGLMTYQFLNIIPSAPSNHKSTHLKKYIP